MIIDAHQHFWTLARGDYPWPDVTVAPIFRDFGPTDLAPLLSQTGVIRTVLVQATDTVAETRFLLDLATETEFVAGVVGWVDLAASDAVETIDALRSNPRLLGLRPMLQNIADSQWILSDAAQPALAHMQAVGLRFDALIQPRHLDVIKQMAQRYPSLSIVVDHIAKPAMGRNKGPDNAYRDGIVALAAEDNVFCKLSGLVTEVGPEWVPDDLVPFASLILEQFGPNRVMFGSDWPVVNLASDYGAWVEFVSNFLSPMSPRDRQQVLADTAAAFYGLQDV